MVHMYMDRNVWPISGFLLICKPFWMHIFAHLFGKFLPLKKQKHSYLSVMTTVWYLDTSFCCSSCIKNSSEKKQHTPRRESWPFSKKNYMNVTRIYIFWKKVANTILWNKFEGFLLQTVPCVNRLWVTATISLTSLG